MKKFLLLCAIVSFGMAVGCGAPVAEPPTEAEIEATQAPVDDMMKQMQSMNSGDMKEAPDFSGGGAAAGGGAEAGGGDAAAGGDAGDSSE